MRVTVAGEKLQVTPTGKPDPQLRVMGWLKPRIGVMVRATDVDPPEDKSTMVLVEVIW